MKVNGSQSVLLVGSIILILLLGSIPIGVSLPDLSTPWKDVWEEVGRIWSALNGNSTKIEALELRINQLEEKNSDLISKIDALGNQSNPIGYIGQPAYDSGWVNFYGVYDSSAFDQNITLQHNLNTTDVFVYIVGDGYYGMSQAFYGGEISYNGPLAIYPHSWFGVFWSDLTNTSITINKGHNDSGYNKIRVMIWKIQKP